MGGPTALSKSTLYRPLSRCKLTVSACAIAKLVGAKQGDTTALQPDVPECREATESPVDVLATSAHEAGEVPLREFHCVPFSCGQVEELAGDAAGYVMECKFGKSLIFGPHVCAEDRDDLPHRRRVGLQEFDQGSSVQHKAFRLHQRLRVGTSRAVLLQHADLSKNVT